MATIGGPNTEKDNLVFGYDTGYGVADNTTATRFYPGEPTTNSTILTGYGWNGDGSNQSFANKGATTITDNSLKYNGYDTVLWTPGSSLNCYLNGSSNLNLNDNSTIWTFSCYVKRDDGAAITSLSVYMYYPNSDGSASGTIVDCGNGWYRVSRTRTGTSDNIGLAGFTGFSSGHKYYLSGVMLTKNNHTVPYVNVQSLRSSTQSLIDLTKTIDIDVSNVSFDSTGQPDFDGTDDKIVIADQTSIGAYTYETVVKINTADSSYSGFGSNYKSDASGYSGVGNGWVLRLDPSGNLQIYTKNNSTTLINPINISGFRANNSNKYIHLVYTYEDGSNKLYLNGALQQTGTGLSGETASDSTLIIGAYSWGIATQIYYLNGHQPVAKLYNTTLSADEVKQNYNAVKNRFDI